VVIKPWVLDLFDPDTTARCAQVTVTPEANNNAVLSAGNSQGSIGLIPSGGQTAPIAIEGAKAV